ncbi:meiosis-specific coiled-coil domain-containing protein MEIOC [Latimeria chalumnae]|uniref:Meiosis specific with coiled-coil domain n=1 Tax=Latimeria chalumnae TaxID=7897 RepID=M3XHD3_LATCH|nr:PREDICTED: uncharacterized protein C17orf104 homolog [Latimeria chalumnae]|eukprot:XP_006000225.1 PREDICTED: uncharacterized protein C17orf104 homolog [Latimeria chalumnae]
MEPKTIFKGATRYCSGTDASNRLTDAFSNVMTNAGSFFGCYKLQANHSDENLDPHQSCASSLSTVSDYSSSIESSLYSTPWSTHGEDYKQLGVPHVNSKNRIQTERNDYGSETDLYGLVSNILEEPDKSQSFFVDGRSSSSLKSIWPSHSSRVTEQHDLLSDVKRPVDTAFSQQTFHGIDSFAAAEKQYLHNGAITSQQKMDELYHGFNNLELTEQWLLPSNNDIVKCYTTQNNENSRVAFQNFPYVKNSFTTSLSDGIKEPVSDVYSFGRDRLCSKDVDPPSNHKAVEMFSTHFSRHTEDGDGCRYPEYTSASKLKQGKSMNFTMQDTKRFSNNAVEEPVFGIGTYNKMPQEKQTQKRLEDLIKDQHSFKYAKSSSVLSENQAVKDRALNSDFGSKTSSECGIKPHIICQASGDYGRVLEKPQFSKHDTQNSTYFKQATILPNSVSSLSSTQNRSSWTNSQNENMSHRNQGNGKKFNGTASTVSKISSHSFSEFPQLSSLHHASNGNSYFQKYGQDSSSRFSGFDLNYNNIDRVQSANPSEGTTPAMENNQMETISEKKIKQFNGFSDNYSPQQHDVIESVNKHMFQLNYQGGHCDIEEDKKQVDFSQNAYQDLLETQSFYNISQRQGGGDNNGVTNRENRTQAPYFSNSYMMGDFRRNPSFPQLGSSGFPSRSAVSFGHTVVPLLDSYELFSYDDLSHLYPYFNDMMYGDTSLPGFVSLGFSRPIKTRSAPASELHIRLEECYDQWRALEKERKKTESALSKNYPGKRMSSSNNTPIPRLPSNPSRVDRLIVDQLREQSRVITLLGKMECLRSSPLHANISTALDKYLEAIHIVQARRKDEIVNASNRQRQGAPRCQDERDVFALASAIKEMTVATRKARTALWCALQMTLPKTANTAVEGQAEIDRVLQEIAISGDKIDETPNIINASSAKK